MKKYIAIIFIAAMIAGCGAEEKTEDKKSEKPKNANTKVFKGQPKDKDGKPIPGIPDPKEANLTDKKPGATPTPGIPDPKKADITDKKGATPTPGIPDPETLKKQMEKKAKPGDVNKPSAKKPAGKVKDPINRPRKAAESKN